MKTKNILISTVILFVVILTTFSIFIKTDENSATNFTNFEIKGESKEELKKFDWNSIEEMFEQNDPEQDISIAVILLKNSDRKNDVKYEVKGKSENIDILTRNVQNSIERLN
ncbi:hypothetical protein [Nonlabens sp.]|uniref:hypothetical protein n=1 Tax=Nonlabens sp. TaxID=1888209 RepID=UPI003F695715